MSRMLPKRMVDKLRSYVDVALDAVGVDCILHIPTDSTWDAAKRKDVFKTPSDYTHTNFDAQVFIEWGPSAYRLKKLGLYVEDQLPILVWFGNSFIEHHVREDYEITLNENFTIQGSGDHLSVEYAVFSNPEGSWGIKEDGAEILVAADTSLIKVGTGQFTYQFNEPIGSDGKTYTYWVKWKYLDKTYYDKHQVTGIVDARATSNDVVIKSYFDLPIEYIPSNTIKTNQFELVNVALKGFQDATIRKIYSAVPRRVEQ